MSSKVFEIWRRLELDVRVSLFSFFSDLWLETGETFGFTRQTNTYIKTKISKSLLEDESPYKINQRLYTDLNMYKFWINQSANGIIYSTYK